MNKKAVISIIVILFIGLVCVCIKNKNLISSGLLSNEVNTQSDSVIKNTTTALHSNNNSFNYICCYG